MKEDTWEQESMQGVHLAQEMGKIWAGDAHLELSWYPEHPCLPHPSLAFFKLNL